MTKYKSPNSENSRSRRLWFFGKGEATLQEINDLAERILGTQPPRWATTDFLGAEEARPARESKKKH